MNRTTQRVGLGCIKTEGSRRIACQFDDETFEAIRRRAVKSGTSFAEQVRLLVEWGLIAAEDDET